MAVIAKVLIHSQGNSEGPLREAIEHYRPQMVFLISNKEARDAPLVMSHLNNRNETKLGRSVRDVEHSEMIMIEDAWSKDTVLQMFEAIDKARKKATGLAKGRVLKFYAGVAGGTKLMVIGSALAAINGDITTYYVNKERIDRQEELLLEIEFMNKLMSSASWLRGHYKNKNNLRYLTELIRRENEGEVTSAIAISETLTPFTDKAVRDAMRKLKKRGLVDFESRTSPQVYKSTLLGRYVIRMFYSGSDHEE